MTKALIAGATGYLGKYVTRAFKEQGYWVRALVRSPEKLHTQGRYLEPPVAAQVDEVFVGDVTRPASLRGCSDGIDVVFSSVGMTRPQGRWTCCDVDYQGNLNLLNEVLGRSVRKFVYVSVFNAQEYEHLAIIKAHEDFVRALRGSGVASTIMRPTAYFSDMSEMLRMAKWGRAFVIGRGQNRLNPIHGADLAQECVQAAEQSEPEVAVGGPQVFRQVDVATLAFAVLGRKTKISRVPPLLAKGAVSLLRPFNKSLADLGDFFLTAGQGEGIAPPTGQHRLREYFEQLADQWKNA